MSHSSPKRSPIANMADFLARSRAASQTAVDKAEPPICRLTDEELAKIFSYLEPLERLSMAEVSRKWARASGLLWTDVRALDLSSIPQAQMGRILSFCSNLKSMVARMQTLPLNSLNANMHDSLEKLALFKVNLAIDKTNLYLFSSALSAYIERLPKLEELIWHNVSAMNLNSGVNCGSRIAFTRGFTLPVSECGSLTKLHLTGGVQVNALQLFDSLTRLPHVRCLTLGNSLYGETLTEILDSFRQSLRAMTALRELCLIEIRVYETVEGVKNTGDLFELAILRDFFELLQQLEVFVLVVSPTQSFMSMLRVLPKWIQLHPNLRLLVIEATSSGYLSLIYSDNHLPFVVPPRQRYPKGFGSDPLPFLNVFLGAGIAGRLSFSQSTNAKIWPISERLPEFLEKPEIAEIAGGVWALDVVKDAAKRLIDFWRY